MAINRDKVLREAEKLVQRGKVEQAIREYEKLLQSNPNDPNTINRVGDLYGRLGQVDRAVELFERTSDHFAQAGFTAKAIAILKKINRLCPQRLDIFDRLAELYVQQGLPGEAKNQYQVLADWYVRNGDLPKAVEVHRKLVQLDSTNHMAHLRLADLLLQVGEASEALECYGRLGRMLLQRGKLDEAERLYRHALDQSPPSGGFLVPLLEALLEAGRGPVARELLTSALKLSPDSIELRMLEVRSMVLLGEARAALEKGKSLLAADPSSVPLRSLVGRVLLDSGEAAEARDLLAPVVERALARGDYHGAQNVLQGLLKAMPQDQQVLKFALRAFEPGGDREMLFTLRAALADSLFRSGQSEGAHRLYMELVSEQSENTLFRQRLAQLEGVVPGARATEQMRVPPAEEVEEVIEIELPDELELEPAGAVPAVAPELEEPPVAPFDAQERLAEANVFAKYGLVDKAIHQLEEILRYCSHDVVVRAKLVELYLESGQLGLAREVAPPLLDHYEQVGDTHSLQALQAALPLGPGAGVTSVDDGEEPLVLIELEDEGPIGFPVEEEPVAVVAADDIRFEVDELPAVAAPADDLLAWDGAEEELGEVEIVELPLAPDEEWGISEAESPEPGLGAGPFDGADAVSESPDLAQGDLELEPAWEEPDEASPLAAAGPEDTATRLRPGPVAPPRPVVPRPEPLQVEPPRPPAPAPLPAAGRAVSELADLERSLRGRPAERPRPPAPPAGRVEGPAPADLVDSLLRDLPPRPAPRPATRPERPDSIMGEAPAPAWAAVSESGDVVFDDAPFATGGAPAAPEPPPPAEVHPLAEEVEVLEDELVEISESLAGPAASDLNQVDLFIDQELYDDAIRMLDALQRDFPDDPEVAERRAVLKAKGLLVDEGAMAAEGAEELFADEEDYFDLAKELEEELAREEAMVEEATGRGKDEALLEEVFREFQKGVAEQLSEEDSDTHFNLGIAYKEMGLLPEAIREFQVASRNPSYYVECCSMIGVCYVEQGMGEQAADWYRKAMAGPGVGEEALVALRYDLASALELAGDLTEAHALFDEVAATNPEFRDVLDRLTLLAQQRPVN